MAVLNSESTQVHRDVSGIFFRRVCVYAKQQSSNIEGQTRLTSDFIFPDAREFTLDLNTAHRDLYLSEGNTRVVRGTQQLYPDHLDRFDFWRQVLCQEGISASCYWEVEWSVKATIGVAYRRMCRKGEGCDAWLGQNAASWSLSCSSRGYSVCHNKKTVSMTTPHISSRIGLYLDWPAGKLSFYKVSSGTLTHLHSFHTTFTERLYPGFRLGWIKSSVALVQVE